MHEQEVQYHINEAVISLRRAASLMLAKAPQLPQSKYLAAELAGNDLLNCVDQLVAHLPNVAAVAAAVNEVR